MVHPKIEQVSNRTELILQDCRKRDVWILKEDYTFSFTMAKRMNDYGDLILVQLTKNC